MTCSVYWGSHGCKLAKNHKGYCECDCCICDDEHTSEPIDGFCCVAKFPYYGNNTWFYGDDVKVKGLPKSIEEANEYWKQHGTTAS